MNSPAICVENLSFQYPNGQLALSEINMTISQGEKVALLGLNGAGKSTLLLHLNGILRSPHGTIQIQGLNLTDANLPKIRAKVGLVFQNPDDQLFCLNVYDDVAFGPRYMGLSANEVQNQVAYALDAVGMSGFEKRSSYHLSIGEKKRIALATVLSMNVDILVLDEPSAGLDEEGKKSLIQLLQGMDKTLLISSHDLALTQALCNRVLMMEKGRIISETSYHEAED